MRISEAAERSGLDISAVRFYERKGLIAPERTNTYRDYTEEDILRLKQIVLLRRLDFSIEDIRRLLLEDADIEEMLVAQEKLLEERSQQIQGALSLCRAMLKDDTPAELDVDYYLSYVEKEERQGMRFPELLPFLDNVAENAGMERFVGYPFAGLVMKNLWLKRLVGAGVTFALLIFPVMTILASVYEIALQQGSFYKLIFWGVYSVISISTFWRMMRFDRDTFRDSSVSTDSPQARRDQ